MAGKRFSNDNRIFMFKTIVNGRKEFIANLKGHGGFCTSSVTSVAKAVCDQNILKVYSEEVARQIIDSSLRQTFKDIEICEYGISELTEKSRMADIAKF